MVPNLYEQMRLEFDPIERDIETARVIRGLAILGERGAHGEQTYTALHAVLRDIQTQGSCDEQEYLRLAAEAVALLAPDVSTPEVAQAVLDLSRLHAGVRDFYEQHQLAAVLAERVAAAPTDCTERNQVLYADMFFHHHLWAAHRQRLVGGWPAFIRYLREQPLLWREPGVAALRSTVHDAIHTGVRKDDRETLELLRRELGADPGVARTIDKRLAAVPN